MEGGSKSEAQVPPPPTPDILPPKRPSNDTKAVTKSKLSLQHAPRRFSDQYCNDFNEYSRAYERAQVTGLLYINPYSRFITPELLDKINDQGNRSSGTVGGSRRGKSGSMRQSGGQINLDDIKRYVKLIIFCILAFFGFKLTGDSFEKALNQTSISFESVVSKDGDLENTFKKHLNPLFDLLNQGDLNGLATQYNKEYEQIDSENKDALFYVIDNFVYQKQLLDESKSSTSSSDSAKGGGPKFKNPLTGRLIDPKGNTALKLLKLHAEGSIKLPRKICSVIKKLNK
jgi:hypothetical protein